MPDTYKYNYNYNGAAAYQAVPAPRPARLPEEKPAARPKAAPKARPVIAPLAVIGLAVVAVLLTMVIQTQSRYYETRMEAGRLEAQLAEVQAETVKLRSTYESRIDLAQIEERARELGMTQPSTRQTVYLNIAGSDHAEVLRVDERSYLEKIWDALTAGFRGVTEYFR